MRTKLLSILFLIIMAGGLAAGCGNSEEETESIEPSQVEALPTETASESQPEPSETELVVRDGARSILTGEVIGEEAASKRPVAVMVENTSACLPHYGTSKADVIYECPVEGGITRMMAIFQDYSGLEKLGNVRSCRTYYIYFAKEFDAIYVCSGKAIYALELLQSDFIDQIDGTTGKAAASFYRTNDRKKPHNLYTSTDGINQAIEKFGYETKLREDYPGHYQFAADGEQVDLSSGADAAVVTLYYPNPKPWFVYNSEDGLYYRYEFKEKQIDAVTNEQLAVKNIIIQDCDSTTLDDNGYLDINCMSGGSGKFITNGKCIDITWIRESESAPTRYFDASGKEITLNQGKTWVCISQSSYSEKNKIFATAEEYESSK